jgi:hypothetical protein
MGWSLFLLLGDTARSNLYYTFSTRSLLKRRNGRHDGASNHRSTQQGTNICGPEMNFTRNRKSRSKFIRVLDGRVQGFSVINNQEIMTINYISVILLPTRDADITSCKDMSGCYHVSDLSKAQSYYASLHTCQTWHIMRCVSFALQQPQVESAVLTIFFRYIAVCSRNWQDDIHTHIAYIKQASPYESSVFLYSKYRT